MLADCVGSCSPAGGYTHVIISSDVIAWSSLQKGKTDVHCSADSMLFLNRSPSSEQARQRMSWRGPRRGLQQPTAS